MSKQQQRSSPATSSSSTATVPSSSPSSMTKQAKPTVVPTTSSLSSSSTTMKMVLMIVSLHILGILFGFGIFYIIFHNECAHRINSIQIEYNTSINTLQNEKLTQQEQIESNIISNHEKNQQEQETMNKHYNECIQIQTTLYEKLQLIQQNEMKLQIQIHNITKQNEELQTNIQHKEKQYNNIQNQFNLTKIMMHEKINEVERYKQILHNHIINYDDTTSYSEYDTTSIIQQQQQTSTNDTINIVQIQADIKRRHYAMIQQTFGIEQQQHQSSTSSSSSKVSSSSYHVLFVLQNSINQVITSIVIELDAIYDMSHTTFTFLSMIQNQFYINTSFQSIQSNIIKQQQQQNTASSSLSTILIGGHPNTCSNTMIESKLKRQYAEYGYNIEHLLYFTERNMKQKCRKTSISFLNHGPDLILYINDPTTTTTTANTRLQPLLDTCFGHIISGFDSLVEQLVPPTDNEQGNIDNHNRQEQRFTIIDARIIMNANNNQDDS